MLEWATIVGAVVSTTVTVKEPLTVNPPESVTEQLTVVVPKGKVLPEEGLQAGVRGLPRASLAVTE
jgi:hypothetical protein